MPRMPRQMDKGHARPIDKSESPVDRSPSNVQLRGKDYATGNKLVTPDNAYDDGSTSGVPVTRSLEQATGRLAESLSQLGEPYPEDATAPPPTSLIQAQGRLQGYGIKRPLSDAEREWTYKLLRISGTFKMAKSLEDKSDPHQSARAAIAAYALSQVGLVEANVSIPDPTGKRKHTRKGIEHLQQYHVAAGRGRLEGDQLNPRVPVGTDGENVLPSWCQTFAKWAVQAGGGTYAGGSSGAYTKDPKVGDVAYMSKANHMAVVVAVDGNSITTVDGNMPTGSVILVVTRNKSAWDHGFYRSFPAAADA